VSSPAARWSMEAPTPPTHAATLILLGRGSWRRIQTDVPVGTAGSTTGVGVAGSTAGGARGGSRPAAPVGASSRIPYAATPSARGRQRPRRMQLLLRRDCWSARHLSGSSPSLPQEGLQKGELLESV
jgi:hypothetical protein